MAVTNDMSADRRVARHVAALHEFGYDVILIHRKLRDRKEKENNFDCGGEKERISLSTAHDRGWRFYAEYNVALKRKLVRLKPDAIWANDTDTLLGCWWASRRLHCRLVLDAHELFPEVPEIQHKPLVKAVWRSVERMLMPQCDAIISVCNSIAEYYRNKYNVKVDVVRNLPIRPDASVDRTEKYDAIHPHLAGMKVLLYQGCVNVGRGVDWAIDALEWLPQCQLVVAGRGDLLEQMKRYAASKPWADRIDFLGHVPPDELPALTCRADVGLVMLEDMGLSYHYALPNRIGDFVAAGVPMVVSDLPEMAAVVHRFGVGVVIENAMRKEERGKRLAEAVEKVLSRSWSDADFAEARNDMDWNKEKQILKRICFTTF